MPSLHKPMMTRRIFLGAGASCSLAALAPTGLQATPDAVTVARAINTIELTSSMMSTAIVEMYRTNAQTRRRSLEIAQLRQGSSDLSLRRYVFLTPADISGTKLLVHEKSKKANDLWLLLPSVGKPRRLSASKQSNSFAGTDFSYADLMAIKIEKFDHEILKNNSRTVTLQSSTKSAGYAKEIGYARSVVTADASSFVPRQVDYYDRKARLLKTQKIDGARMTPDGRFVLTSRDMVVHRNGNRTLFLLGKVDFRSGLGKSDFKPQRL